MVECPFVLAANGICLTFKVTFNLGTTCSVQVVAISLCHGSPHTWRVGGLTEQLF